ncbi:MAG TPA: HAMP domain-containing sensor histidine kinase [Flavobacterium sp.]|uniref:sensor histidine kinase n=1 Tax=Flavobacterium sp. TaxID=239 RepID=UPI002DBF6FEB|nr:HAMP domain-containing sensor histidine kinase [Flavobacterium sp.]HEU4788353.1 HAMP domain-containing sensor histidine kinase [Flavobacterium sp.]
MSQLIFFKKLRSSNLFILLIIVFLSCALLIVINFFTIKILSASRAYVNGESHYSKAQKDAVRHLIIYIYTQDKREWKLYKEEIKVPQGDGIARAGLLNHAADTVIRNGFLAGRNKKEDLDDVIWMFKNFKNVSFMAKAIKEWEQGDIYINQLSMIGNDANRKFKTSKFDSETKQKMLLEISILSNKLTINERNFSNTLGEGTHTIKDLLIYINIFFILIIISSVCYYYSIMIKRLIASKTEIEIKNENLIMLNGELDNFVYSVSHDLRSPITSMKGLIQLAKLEDDLEQISYYLKLMSKSLNRQDQFISDIIDYSKNKRMQILLRSVSLNKLIDDAIKQHNYNKNADKIIITKDLSIDEIQSDSLRLKIILNNLLSNAIKYVDENKKEMKISIRTYNSGVFHKIEVIDNGIGIQEEYKDHIFDMFFVINSNKGSGLGLYIVKETLDKLNGSIVVFSESNVGSKFTVTIPNLYLYGN